MIKVYPAEGYGMHIRSGQELAQEVQDVRVIAEAGGGTLPPDNCRIGWADYDSDGTDIIAVTGGAGAYFLTNNTLGAQTKTNFLPVGVSSIWNPTTDKFDFSSLANGDMVDIRIAALVTTTSPNQQFDLSLRLGVGGFQYVVPFASGQIKNVGTTQVSRFNGIYIGDDNTRLNAGEWIVSSESDATIEVQGWYCKILKRG